MRLRARQVVIVVLGFCGVRGWAQVTESPSVVARGTWLVESDIVSFESRREHTTGGVLRESGVVIGAVTLSTGIADRLDLQVGTEAYLRSGVAIGGTREVVSGRGDSYVRMKWNLAGNEGSGPAFAVLPWVKFPTAAAGVGSGETDWGVIVPFGAPLSNGAAVNAMVEFARPADGEGARDSTWFFSAAVVAPLADGWEWYGEATAGFVAGRDSESTATVGAGVRRKLSRCLVLDFEVLAGLTTRSPDWSPALRIEWGF